jgi:hypothetical protein
VSSLQAEEFSRRVNGRRGVGDAGLRPRTAALGMQGHGSDGGVGDGGRRRWGCRAMGQTAALEMKGNGVGDAGPRVGRRRRRGLAAPRRWRWLAARRRSRRDREKGGCGWGLESSQGNGVLLYVN